MEQFISKIKTKINVKNLIILFILAQPVIDLLTSLCVRNISSSLSIGVFLRTIFMGVISIYALIISDKKYRKKLIIYFASLAIYLGIFLISCYMQNGMSLIVTQLKGIIKTFYLPVVLMSLIPIFKKYKIEVGSNIFSIVLFEYSIVIFLAKILGISYNAYGLGYNKGTVGLFYAANEIGTIMVIIVVGLVNSLLKQKVKIFDIIASVLYIYASLEMGTKVPFLGVIGIIAVTILICSIKFFANKAKEIRKRQLINIGSTIAISILIVLTLGYTSIGKNLEMNYGIEFFRFGDESSNIKDPNEGGNKIDYSNKEEVETAIVSSRNIYFDNNYEIFKNSQIQDKLFGIGYVDEKDGELKELKLVEMDYFDIFFCTGIIGTIIYFIPLISLLISILIKVIKNIKKVINREDIILMGYGIGIALGIALLAGHVLTAPAVNLYMIILVIQANEQLQQINR